MWPLEKSLYVVSAAKFVAESVSGIGKQSITLIHCGDGSFKMMLDLKDLRTLWEAEGRPKIPNDAVATAKRLLDAAQFHLNLKRTEATLTLSTSQKSADRP